MAWVCANSPQAATYAVIAWIGEARSFSHQQQLTVDLAHLLAGEDVTPPALSTQPPEDSRSEPIFPAAAALKKIELALEKTVKPLAPAQGENQFRPDPARYAGMLRVRPPHEPPRAAVVS